VVLSPNGVTSEDFAQPSLPPPGLRGLSRPVLGYVGVITDWFDVEMVAEAARLRPGWTFLLVGRVLDVDVGGLRGLRNVVLAGEQPYSALSSYTQLFDLCLIPHRRRPRTHAAGSVKFFEYLCLGKPVVASRLRWLEPWARRGLVSFAADGAGLVSRSERLLSADGPRAAARRRREAERQSWKRRYEDLWPHLAATFVPASVVIPVHDNLEGTRRCLESLFQHTSYPNYEVVVMDNGSRDATPAFLERLRRSESRLRVIRHARILGFAAAANRGLRAARGRVLVLLNNDTVVTPGWLGGLIAHLLDPRVGAVGPVTNRAGNQAQVDVDYPVTDGVAAFAAAFTARHGNQRLEVDRLSMFCLALPRAVYEEVGPLDERFSVGMFEDDDYARRIRATGRRLLCVSDVFVHHVGHGTFRLLGPDAFERAFRENRQRFEKKWGTTWTSALPRPQRD
jgi:GT2 family glycosyltransferase